MAGKTLSFFLKLNDKDFQSGLKKSTRSLQKFGSNMQRLGDDLTRNVSLPILAIGAGAVKMASDLEETDSKFRTVFSSLEEQAVNTAKAFQKEFGLAEETTKNLLGATGDLLVGFGFSEQAALELSQKVNSLSVDLASFTNFEGGAAGASRALTKALVGETESAKALGIVIRQGTADYKARVEQIMAEEKVSILQAKAIANLQIAYEQSGKAIGDYQRTSESLANQTRRLQESLKDLGGQFGKDLIPVAQSAIKVANKLLSSLANMTPETRENVIQYGALALVLGPLIGTFGRILKVVAKLRVLFVGKIVPAVTALYRAFKLLTPQGRILSVVLAGVSMALPILREKFGSAKKEVENFKNMVSTTGDIMEKSPLFDPKNFAKPKENIEKTTGAAKKLSKTLEEGASNFESEWSKEMKLAEVFEDLEKMDIDTGVMFKGLKFESVDAVRVYQELLEEEFDFGEEEENVVDPFNYEQVIANFDAMQQKMKETQSTFQSAFHSMAQSADASFQDIANGAANAARQVIKTQIAEATAAYAAKVFSSVPFPFNLALAAAAGSVVGSLFNKIIPPFADGGMVSGATLAMVGEGAGTSAINPEVIAPLDKLQGMIGNAGGQVEVVGKISGADILLASDRAQGNRKRTRGY